MLLLMCYLKLKEVCLHVTVDVLSEVEGGVFAAT